MDALVRAALVGTARQPDVPTPDLAAVTGVLDDRSPERRLLLAAGARAVARTAGTTAVPVPDAPAPAPPEDAAACSGQAGRHLEAMLRGRHAEVLPEALSLLAGAGLRLPHHLLPLALAADPDLHDGLRPLLGARGAWLAKWLEAWQWALEPEQAEVEDPDEGRLERDLDHRSVRRRLGAARKLARMPESRLSRHMARRAGGLLDSSMAVTLPTELDGAWRRDLGSDRAPEGMGQKAGWLLRTVALVSPALWEDRFGRKPWRLVQDVSPDDVVLAEALSRAALLHGATEWLGPLWDWWQARVGEGTAQGPVLDELRAALLARMPQDHAEARIAPLLTPEGHPGLEPLLEGLPAPWSAGFSRIWLVALHAHLATLGGEAEGFSLPWLRGVGVAARALAPDTLDEALGIERPAPSRSWRIQQWRGRLDAFTETVRVRRDLFREIPR